MKRSAVLLTAIFLLLAGGIASAQQSDISLSAIGVFTNSVTAKGLNESATKSGGALLSYRYFPHQHNGLEVNLSYSLNSQTFKDLSGKPVTRAQTNVYELTGAYVYHFTHGSLQPFALAGGGFLIFGPTSNTKYYTAEPSISRVTRPAFLYGAGLDYRLHKQLAVRAQIRGFIYEAPDFFGQSYALHTATAMRMVEPSLGVVYRF